MMIFISYNRIPTNFLQHALERCSLFRPFVKKGASFGFKILHACSHKRLATGKTNVKSLVYFLCIKATLHEHQIKENIKRSAVPALCEGNPPGTGGIPSQRDSNADNVSISWPQIMYHLYPGKDGTCIMYDLDNVKCSWRANKLLSLWLKS